MFTFKIHELMSMVANILVYTCSFATDKHFDIFLFELFFSFSKFGLVVNLGTGKDSYLEIIA